MRAALIASAAIVAACLLWVGTRAENGEPAFTLRHEIEIAAPPAEVWPVLVDFASYPEWNPYLIRVEGEAQVGNEVSLTIVQRNWEDPFTVPATLSEVDPAQRLGWRGVALMRGIHDTHHTFRLEALPGDRTRLQHAEAFSGLLPRLIYDDTTRSHTEAAFRAMNEALAARFESATPVAR